MIVRGVDPEGSSKDDKMERNEAPKSNYNIAYTEALKSSPETSRTKYETSSLIKKHSSKAIYPPINDRF